MKFIALYLLYKFNFKLYYFCFKVLIDYYAIPHVLNILRIVVKNENI